MTPQTQFTPGPYTSDDDLILDSSDYVLAVVQPNENHEGNVALFRSAPSLYAALKAVHHALSDIAELCKRSGDIGTRNLAMEAKDWCSSALDLGSSTPR